MNALQSVFDAVASPVVIQGLGWLLVHSLWQCLLTACLAMCLGKLMRRQSSSARYWMYSLALSLMVVAPAATMLADRPMKSPTLAIDRQVDLSPDEPLGAAWKSESVAIPHVKAEADARGAASQVTRSRTADESGLAVLPASYSSRIRALLSPWLSTLVSAWCCGVLLFALRPIRGWFMVRRLLRSGTSPAAAMARQSLRRMSDKMQVRRRVEVLTSSLVDSPIVVGCFRSVILVPASLVSSLPTAQLEAILAHELAHVRRYDYLVNLLQTLVETAFFYHPAVWWLSHRIRVERENCCDDLAVSVLEDRVEYGRALLAVEEFRGAATRSALALGAKDGSLLCRVRRLLAGPIGGDQRMSGGVATAAFAAVGLMIAIAWWSAMAIAQSRVDDAPFGEAAHGLRARIVALRSDVDDDSPNLRAIQRDYERADDMTFGVELMNTSEKPITLALQNRKSGLKAPIWFQLQFLDRSGKPHPRVQRELYTPWHYANDSSTTELAPGKSLTVVLRPSGYRAPFKHDLPAGKYQVQVRYQGPDASFKKSLREHSPDDKILQAWEHSVESNLIEFGINKSNPRLTPEQLSWGKPVNGLQAATEFRVAGDMAGTPSKSPGIPVGTSFTVLFHVKNVSDKRITFISETGRQGDRVHVTNERGEKVDVKDVWFSGWPIDVAWRLEPGETAQLDLLTPSLSSLDQPGRYNVRYTLRFNSRIQKDDAGAVTFPRPGDYDQEVTTGEASLFLSSAQSNATADKAAAMEATRAGRWRITEGVELEITQKLAHAADVMTSGVIRWQAEQDQRRHVPLSIAMDHFANRERWKAVWEEGRPVLWIAKGRGQGPGRRLAPGTKVKIEELRRVDFSDPECVVHHVYNGWVADQLPSAEIRTALEQEFVITSDGKEHHRYYESARQGLQANETSRQIYVWVGEKGDCQVEDLAWAPNTGQPREIKCNLDTLSQTLALVLKKFHAKANQDAPIHAFVTSRPDLPAEDLKSVLAACRGNGLKTPDLPAAMQVSATTTETVSDSPQGEIRGVLIDAEGNPVGGAIVACGAIYREDGKDGGARTTTDAEGRYRLVVPTSGIYTVFLKAYDKDPTLTAAADDGLKVEAGKITESTLRLVAGQKVVGEAVDENGAPLAGLTVMCYSAARPHSLGGVQSTISNVDGAFEFFLAPGPGRIYAMEKVSKSEENPLGTGRVGSIDLTVAKSGAVDPVMLKLSRKESRFGGDEWLARSTPGTRILSSDRKEDVTGTVVDEAGTLLANVLVIKTDDKPATSDAEGRFRVPCRKGTQFVMHAFLSGYQVWFGTPTAGDELRIVLVKKQHSDDIPAANGNRAPAAQPKNPESRLDKWKNAWREYYAEQSTSDATLARSAFADLTGAGASDEDVKTFVSDSARDKRTRLIDRLLTESAYERFQAQLSRENEAFQTQQRTLPPRILRGPQAKARADAYQPKSGSPVDGLTLAVALRSAAKRFKVGERIPLDVILLNSSNKAMTRDFSFDFIANPPRVLDESGSEVPIERLLLRGGIPLFRETLRPGDRFVYPHIGLGLGDNPTPGENWHPHTPRLQPGKYRLSQRWNDLTSGEIEFEVVAAEEDNAGAARPKSPAPTKTLPDSLNVMSVGFHADGKLWSIATRRNVSVRKWELESNEKLSDVQLETEKHANQYLMGELQLSPDRLRVMAMDDGKVALWDSTTGKRVATLAPPAGQSAHRGLSCSPDFSRAACGLFQQGGFLSRDAQAVVWDLKTGQVIRTVTHANAMQIHCTAVSREDRWLATGSQEAGLCIWDAGTGDLKHHIANDNAGRKHPDASVELKGASQVLSLCFSPDGTRLAMTDMLGVKIFDVESGKLLNDFERPFRFGRSGLVFSPDGSVLARVGTDKAVSLWNLRTGGLIAELPSESHSGSFSMDGQWFAVGYSDETNGIRAWRIVTEIAPPALKGAASPAWLRFCPGTQIVEHTDAPYVSGVVVDEQGRPISGCSVEHPGLVSLKTDEQGRFQYKQSTPHRTVLRAYHPDYRLWHGAPELGDVVRIVLHKMPKVEAADGTREMTVRVIDSRTAEPVRDVTVTATRYEGPRNGTIAATVKTNRDGAVVLRGLDHIQHRLSLSAEQPVPYIGNLAYPGADQLEVVMLVDRACELVLRAVDSETGQGIAGVRFDRERALAELWAEPVVSDILGGNRAGGGETLTDGDGYSRFLVGPATWSYMILKYPAPYGAIEPIAETQEVEIPTPVGGRVERTIRLVRKKAAGDQ